MFHPVSLSGRPRAGCSTDDAGAPTDEWLDISQFKFGYERNPQELGHQSHLPSHPLLWISMYGRLFNEFSSGSSWELGPARPRTLQTRSLPRSIVDDGQKGPTAAAAGAAILLFGAQKPRPLVLSERLGPTLFWIIYDFSTSWDNHPN